MSPFEKRGRKPSLESLRRFKIFIQLQSFFQYILNASGLVRTNKEVPVAKKLSDHELAEIIARLNKKHDELIELEKRNSFENTIGQLILCWSVCVLSMMILNGLGYLNLSDNVLIALAGSPFISTCLAFFDRRRRQ
jgi:hypothetical protein